MPKQETKSHASIVVTYDLNKFTPDESPQAIGYTADQNGGAIIKVSGDLGHLDSELFYKIVDDAILFLKSRSLKNLTIDLTEVSITDPFVKTGFVRSLGNMQDFLERERRDRQEGVESANLLIKTPVLSVVGMSDDMRAEFHELFSQFSGIMNLIEPQASVNNPIAMRVKAVERTHG